jgi:hypothetical protein
MDVADLPTREILTLYRQMLSELRKREVIRTDNSPTGDLAEHLVAKALGGRISDNRSEASWDVEARDGSRLQVKARITSAGKERPVHVLPL